MTHPRFGPARVGCTLQPIPNVDPENLRRLLTGAHGLPRRLHGRPGLDRFVQRVVAICEIHASMLDHVPRATAAATRDALLALEAAAHRMQNSLAPLRTDAASPDPFEALDSLYWYLAQRARDPRTAGRPVVPAVPVSIPSDLSELLSLIEDGLSALRATCAHAAGQIKPSAAVEKDRERAFARAVAMAYAEAFDKLPPAGGWFGRYFMPELGDRLGLDIGHKVVAMAVNALIAESTPPPG